MARLPRVVIADIPHHVTQRGNARQVILGDDPDRGAYLELLRQYCALYSLSLLGYCLMPNHVHLIVIPRTREALWQTLSARTLAGHWEQPSSLLNSNERHFGRSRREREEGPRNRQPISRQDGFALSA